MRRRVFSIALLLIVGVAVRVAHAQSAQDTAPAFTLSSSHIFTTRERPALTLTYRRVDHLDFRVYKVNDALAFFEKLKDPHQLGSEEPVVPQERTWLERVAIWKSARRSDIRAFLRGQVSSSYRQVRHEQQDTAQIVLRQTLNVNSFAQVPLLNASQLTTSWREILPPVRDTEVRHVPLDISGPGIYVVEAVNAPLRAYTVVVVSDVGLVTKTAPGELLVFAANRFSGDPAVNCRIRVLADQKTVGSGTTAADGTFASTLIGTSPDALVTVADCGGQPAATDPGAYTLREPGRDLVGYTYTDRPVYRPGHTVHYKSVLRWREKDALLPFGLNAAEVSIVDGNDKVLARERKTIDAFGALTGSFVIPPAAPLGYYTIRVASGDSTATGSFEVQEYRKPEFDVAVRPATAVQLQDGNVKVTVAARYYFGQPVSDAAVTIVVHKQFYFSPLRYDGSDDDQGSDNSYAGGEEVFQTTARLNIAGTTDVAVPLEIDPDGRDYTARIEARVSDASDREVSGAASVVATYGRFLVITRPERYVYQPGETANLNIRTLDYSGTPQASVRVHASLERVEYTNGYGNPPVITTLQEGDVQTDADGRARWSAAAPGQAGSYRIRATAPSEGRSVTDVASIWVPGPRSGAEDSDQFLELIADKRTYQPGDTARIVVRGADFEASVLVTKESQHISFHQVVRTRGNDAFSLPITDEDVGDTYVSIAFLKDDRLYRAERRLMVPATQRQLTVTAETDKPVVRPGEPGAFALRVVDANGAPVRAQLSVGLVDEAIYGVRADSTPDPLRFFYRREYNRVGTSFSRDYSFVGYSGTEQLLLARRHRPMTLADFKADRPDRPRVRKDFPDTVLWLGDVTTDANGRAQVKVDYPDSLTTWRLTVRAVTIATDVGSTLAHTLTTKDLLLRVVTPRFLTEGDRVIFPTIVHNYLPSTKIVSVSFGAEGLTPAAASGASGTAPRTIQVAQNGQQRLDWSYIADRVAPVRITGRVTSDTAGDAVQLSLPVVPAGLQRNTGTSGSIIQAGERTIDLTIPAAANASGRSVRVALAPSIAGAMLGALDYLTSYPWGCTEQTLSTVVPNLTVMRALADLQIAPAERLASLDRQVSEGLKRLYDYQHEDGGWGWWKTDDNHPFMTAYAIDGLVRARDAGAKVDDWRIANGANALRQLYAKYPQAIPDLKAYEIYVLVRAGAVEGIDAGAAIDELWGARSRMTTTGRALLLLTLDQRKDPRAVDLTADLVKAAESRGDLAWWPVASDPLLEDIGDTSVEASALALKAIAARDPQNPVLERVARWLIANRTGGAYWFNTKQTAAALDGLLSFMKARGERPAPVTADVFVNGTRAGRQTFDAKSLTAPNPVVVETPATEGPNIVRIVTEGEGALYFDATVRYYDKAASQERTGSRKLALVREYFSLTPVQRQGRIVYRESPFNGTARAGDLVLVRLTAAGSADWRYLMLEDPIPAGTEQVEKEAAYEMERPRDWFYGSEREFRDDRTAFFLSDFTAGRYEMSYLLRVTTPGTFAAMPARITPMYVPDVFASSAAVTFTIAPDSTR